MKNNKQIVKELKESIEYRSKYKKFIEEFLSCGHCKYLQIDGMFGMWCDKGRNWETTDADFCLDYKR